MICSASTFNANGEIVKRILPFADPLHKRRDFQFCSLENTGMQDLHPRLTITAEQQSIKNMFFLTANTTARITGFLKYLVDWLSNVSSKKPQLFVVKV